MRRTAFATVSAALSLALLSACATSPTTSSGPPQGGVTSPAKTASAGQWTFAFDAGPGVASATLADKSGAMVVRLSCQAPTGDLVVTDWTYGSSPQRPMPTTIYVGTASAQAVGTVAGASDGRAALTASFSPLADVWNALTPGAPVRFAADAKIHTWADGAAQRINDVLNACHQTGS